METGRMSNLQFDRAIRKKLSGQPMPWLTYFRVHAHVKPEVMRFAKLLCRCGYTIGCLTNIDEGAYDYLMRTFDMSVFTRRFASFRIGIRKPDSRIYGYVIRKLRVSPSNIVLIDDIKANVSGARNAGMKAVQFRSLNEAKKRVYSYLS